MTVQLLRAGARVALALGYPLAIYFALLWFEPRWVAAVVVALILLRCDPPAFTRTGHWYDQPPYGFRLMIEAKPLIGATTLLAEESVNGFKPRALTRALERFFTTELEGYERASA